MKKWKYTASALALSIALLGSANATQAQTFKDVPAHVEYYEAVEKLAELGIITKAEKFNPQNDLTRGQMAKMMALALKLDTKNVKDPKFKDVPKSHQFYPYVAALVNAGVVNGYPDGTYGVNKKVTRAHMAKFVVNGFELKKSGQFTSLEGDIKKGTEVYDNVVTLNFYDMAYVPYRPNENLLRADAATMITKAMDIKSAKEVRIPSNELGLVKKVEEYSFSVSSSQNVVDAKTDVLNNEFVLIPLAEGSTNATIELDNESYVLQIDIDAKLNISYKLANSLDSEYKEVREMDVRSEIDSPIVNASLEQVTGVERTKQSLEPVTEGNYVLIPASSDKLGEVFKVTLKHKNGEVQETFVQVQEDSSFIFANQLNVGTANAVKVGFGPNQYALVEGNANAVKIVQDVFELSKVGSYTFKDSEGFSSVKVEVIEVEGKMMESTYYDYSGY